MGLPFYETSAKTNTNIDELFDGVLDLIFDPDEKIEEKTEEKIEKVEKYLREKI